MIYPSLASDRLVDVLRLIRTPNVGPVTFFQLILRYGTAAEALAALPNLSIRGGRRQAVKPFSVSEAQQEIERTDAYGAKLVRYGEEGYPALLHYIEDAPPVLAIKGTVASHGPLVAMVGSRNASANSCQFAQKLAREVGASGMMTVSGLARGIDSFVHKGSLATGTVAVIAGGIDNIYPPEHTALYHEIIERGAIISEQPFGQAPFAGAFPSRNRIIAGMSHGTLVVEASPKSGSLITARLALDYNRELMAVPGSPLDGRAKGCNQLIKNGAHVIEDATDIIRIVQQASLPGRIAEAMAPGYEAAPANAQEVATAHALILGKLDPAGVPVDTLVEQCQISAAVAQAALLELELAGKIRRMAGGKVALIFIDTQEVA